MLKLAAVAMALPAFETLEAAGVPHCQELGVSVVSAFELVGLYFLLSGGRANRTDRNTMDWALPLAVATGWGGAELVANNIKYFIWGNDFDTKWMYIQTALTLNVELLEIISVCVFVYAYAISKPSDRSKGASLIGSLVVILLFRYI